MNGIDRVYMSPQAIEKESINESNISQLQSAVDRMLKESRERLQTYSNERKQLVDEKVQLTRVCVYWCRHSTVLLYMCVCVCRRSTRTRLRQWRPSSF